MAVLVEHKRYIREASQERPIEIFLNGQLMAISQGTPENLSELAIGFLLAEGFLSDRMKLRSVKEDAEKAQVHVVSDEKVPSKWPLLRRVTSAGCTELSLFNSEAKAFLCRSSSRSVEDSDEVCFNAEHLLVLMNELCFLSPRRNTGDCVHGCGVGKGVKLSLVREDIGRHNAMDKLIGQAWLDQLPLQEMALFSTGRISYEMALKAKTAGVNVFVSHKSVTDAAIEFAEEFGLTLVGKCRDGGMQVLSHHRRIK